MEIRRVDFREEGVGEGELAESVSWFSHRFGSLIGHHTA